MYLNWLNIDKMRDRQRERGGRAKEKETDDEFFKIKRRQNLLSTADMREELDEGKTM